MIEKVQKSNEDSPAYGNFSMARTALQSQISLNKSRPNTTLSKSPLKAQRNNISMNMSAISSFDKNNIFPNDLATTKNTFLNSTDVPRSVNNSMISGYNIKSKYQATNVK